MQASDKRDWLSFFLGNPRQTDLALMVADVPMVSAVLEYAPVKSMKLDRNPHPH